jgi:hypothetical protein
MTVDELPSTRPACPDGFESLAHLSEKEISSSSSKTLVIPELLRRSNQNYMK